MIQFVTRSAQFGHTRHLVIGMDKSNFMQANGKRLA